MWNGNVPLHQWKQKRSYSREEDAWLSEEERKERTLWLFEEESFVPAAMIKEGRAYSILTDHLGTPTEAYDAEGKEVWSRTLDMNGKVIEETGNVGMIPFLFQGQYYDQETELAYNRFRYYSPQMGMYVSQDPIRLAGGMSLYGYVEDTNEWIDVFGLAKSYGRTGKQTRLRQLANDPKQPKWVRGWIKNEIRHIKNKDRKTIRLPGNSRKSTGEGKVLAHERGKRAKDGYGYKYSKIQDADLHKLEHKHEGYK